MRKIWRNESTWRRSIAGLSKISMHLERRTLLSTLPFVILQRPRDSWIRPEIRRKSWTAKSTSVLWPFYNRLVFEFQTQLLRNSLGGKLLRRTSSQAWGCRRGTQQAFENNWTIGQTEARRSDKGLQRGKSSVKGPYRVIVQVNKNFGSIFSSLLPGATAQLRPPENKSVLEGLEFKVTQKIEKLEK